MLPGPTRPNTAELEHESDINRRGIERAERHDIPGIFNMIGTIESKLIDGVIGHSDLVEAGTGVQGDEMELAIMRAKILNGIGARGDRNFEGQGKRVELAIRDTEPPNEILNVDYVFLVWFGGKNDH